MRDTSCCQFVIFVVGQSKKWALWKDVNYNQKEKRNREWAIVSSFAPPIHCSQSENSKVRCPDFLLYARNELVGIELTELMYDRYDSKFNLRAHEKLAGVHHGCRPIWFWTSLWSKSWGSGCPFLQRLGPSRQSASWGRVHTDTWWF